MMPRTRLALVCFAGALVTACGGSDEPPPQAAPAGQQQKVAKAKPVAPKKSELAEKKFAALSAEIDKLSSDQPVDPAWLGKQLRAVVEIDPNHHEARYNMAVLAERKGNKAGARKQYEFIVKNAPDFAPAAENLAVILVDAGKPERARAIYKKNIAKDPTNVTSRLGLARLLVGEGKHQEAIELCRKALQRKADAIEAFRILARAYKAVGNSPMAELIIGRGLKVDKDDVELHYMLAEILFERDELAGGISKLKEVIIKKPDWLRVRAQLAAIAMEYRDFGNASQQYEAIIKERPDDRATQVGLAVAYRGLGRYEKAEGIYAKLLKKNNKDLDALWNLASLYHHGLSRWDAAIKFYKGYEGVAPTGDKRAARVEKIVAKITKIKSNRAAAAEREARAKKKKDAIDGACAALAAGKSPAQFVDDIGNDDTRMEVGWALLTEAAQHMNGGDLEAGDRVVKCAFGILPDTTHAKQSGCAPMKVMWTRDILYPLGRLDDALVTIDEALVCDPENPEAQLIKEQLQAIAAQEAAEAAGGEGAEPPADGGAADSGSADDLFE